MPARLKLIAIATLALFIGAFNAAGAQGPKRGAVPDSARNLVGKWTGTYTSDHTGPGDVQLAFAKDSVISITYLGITMQGQLADVPAHDLMITADDISWSLDMMGMACTATAVIKDAQMKGAMVCGHASIQFVATKVPKP